MGQALGDAVDERLAADQADFGMVLGLPDQMLAGAEAHLQPHAAGRQRGPKGPGEVDLRRTLGHIVVGRDDGFCRQFECEAGQQRAEQRLLPSTQLLAPPTTVQRASTGFFHRPLT